MSAAWGSERRRMRSSIRALLDCGHEIKLRDHPMSDVVRFGCTSGLACGYQKWWVKSWSVEKPGVINENRTYKTLKEGEGET